MAYFSHVQGHETILENAQKLVAYRFLNQELLLQSLTHSSYSNENSGIPNGATAEEKPLLADNERLEFLGDAVIGLVVAKALMDLFPEACEGKLSRWRSSLVSRKTLAELALELQLGDCLLLGRGERRTGGAEKRSILAGALEAVVGALYLDGGLEPVTGFLLRIYEKLFAGLTHGDGHLAKMLDKKTHLQERTQSLFKTTPLYRLVDTWGLEHEKHFRVEIVIKGEVVAAGSGRSKKEAEQMAASCALEILGF